MDILSSIYLFTAGQKNSGVDSKKKQAPSRKASNEMVRSIRQKHWKAAFFAKF